MNDKELLARVRQTYRERATKTLLEQELTRFLQENGLTPEEAKTAIYTAIRQTKIRFCYDSSIGNGQTRCYERITKRDEFPPELEEEIMKHTIRQDPGILLIVTNNTQDTNGDNEDTKHRIVRGIGYIEGDYICVRYKSEDKEELRKMKESIKKLASEKATIVDDNENQFKVRISKKDRRIATSILRHAGDKARVKFDIEAERRVFDHLGFKKWWWL